MFLFSYKNTTREGGDKRVAAIHHGNMSKVYVGKKR